MIGIYPHPVMYICIFDCDCILAATIAKGVEYAASAPGLTLIRKPPLQEHPASVTGISARAAQPLIVPLESQTSNIAISASFVIEKSTSSTA